MDRIEEEGSGMTSVDVYVQEDRNGEKKIVMIACAGHANYDEAGRDVLCAATSMAMHILESGVRQYLGVPCTVRTDHAKGEWEIEWPLKEADKAAPFAEVVAKSLANLAEEYPENISFSEEVMV
jgi:uncharacterized protein YsxB (DUF464 family)